MQKLGLDKEEMGLQIKYFIAFLVNPALYRALPNKPRYLCKLIKTYSNCINRYTRTSNRTLWRNRLFLTIFKSFIDKGEFKELVNSDLYMNRAKEAHFTAVS